MTDTSLRVHDAADDLIDDLIVTARKTLERIEEQTARLDEARTAVEAFLRTIRPPAEPAAYTVAEIRTIEAAPAPSSAAVAGPNANGGNLRAVPDVDPHVCPHCGDVLASRNGLAIHVGRKHKITKAPFSEQAARDAAAAAL